MQVNRRTQATRSAATRDALVTAGRSLFGRHGFSAVGTETIVQAAGVTRGALYHQFADKTELFAAVLEEVEQGVTARIDEVVSAATATDPIELMVIGSEAWIDASTEPEIQQILLIDGPAALGWERWREIGMRYGIGLVESLITYGIGTGRIPEQPVRPLAHVLIGALDEAALYVAREEDTAAAREEVVAALTRLITGLTVA